MKVSIILGTVARRTYMFRAPGVFGWRKKEMGRFIYVLLGMDI
jgi:hypothetical protein